VRDKDEKNRCGRGFSRIGRDKTHVSQRKANVGHMGARQGEKDKSDHGFTRMVRIKYWGTKAKAKRNRGFRGRRGSEEAGFPSVHVILQVASPVLITAYSGVEGGENPQCHLLNA
jgi:hypothetical protein